MEAFRRGELVVPKKPIIYRGELKELRQDAQRALPRTNDRATRLHLQDVAARVDQMLDVDSG